MEAQPAKTRAPKVAAPNAERLSLTGVMAVPDTFGRLRILLVDRLASGAPDYTRALLCERVPGREDSRPFELRADTDEGVSGVFWAVPPAHRKAHWLGVAAELRGREVRVEATVRRYTFADPRNPTETLKGASLDISLVEPLAPPERSEI